MASFVYLKDWLAFGVIAGFSTREGGMSRAPFSTLNVGLHVPDERSAVLENRLRIGQWMGLAPEKFVYMQQVHSNQVAVVGPAEAGRGGTAHADAVALADGLVTTAPTVGLAVLAADCVPILLVDPTAGVIAAAHAGWRGTVQNILGTTVSAMVAQGAKPHRIRMAMGPAIRGCCYEVDTPVIDAVERIYEQDMPKRRPKLQRIEGKAGHALLDLPGVVKDQAMEMGISLRFLLDAAVCTHCMPGYFSHRRDHGQTGRHGGFIYRKEDVGHGG